MVDTQLIGEEIENCTQKFVEEKKNHRQAPSSRFITLHFKKPKTLRTPTTS